MPLPETSRRYAIPVEWTAFGVMYIDAPSLAVAVELAETADLPRTDRQDCEDFRVRLEVVRDNLQFDSQNPAQAVGPGYPLTVQDEAWLHKVWDYRMDYTHSEDAVSIMARILFFFRRHPFSKISSEQLKMVAGSEKVARFIRRLRKEEGWLITNGRTVREMEDSDQWNLDDLDASAFGNGDYMLLAETPDLLAAGRWYEAKRIRKAGGFASDRLLEFLKKYVGQTVSNEELRRVAGKKWARRVRELRTEYGWPIKTRNSDRRDLPVGTYVLESLEQLPEHDRQIPDDVQVAVLMRDGYACRKCGWKHENLIPGDPRYSLDLHHLQLHSKGGGNTTANLVTLCNVHHKQVHRENMEEAQVRAWIEPLA